jgi:hypothetical protein
VPGVDRLEESYDFGRMDTANKADGLQRRSGTTVNKLAVYYYPNRTPSPIETRFSNVQPVGIDGRDPPESATSGSGLYSSTSEVMRTDLAGGAEGSRSCGQTRGQCLALIPASGRSTNHARRYEERVRK